MFPSTDHAGQSRRRRFYGLVAALILVLSPASAANSATDETVLPSSSAQALLFDMEWIKPLGSPLELRYRYSHDSADDELYGKSFDDSIVLDVNATEISDQFNSVKYKLFSGARARELGPFSNVRGNPLTIIFLERDIYLTQSYFKQNLSQLRNIIRLSLHNARSSEPIDIDFEQKKTPAQRLTLKPFDVEGLPPELEVLRAKQYEFILSHAVPGGIFEIRSLMPDPENPNAYLIKDQVVFERIVRQ